MKFRFAPVKRPLLALTVFAALIVAMVGLVPAHAVSFNNLSIAGTTGRIRVRSTFEQAGCPTPKGTCIDGAALQTGDRNNSDTNPNRTVGDWVAGAPVVKGNPYFSGCVPFATDCQRTLSVATVPGATSISVSDISGFAVGDTILVGSPYCDSPSAGLTCRKTGYPDQNPSTAGICPAFPVPCANGEIAHVTSGPGIDEFGAGTLTLAEGLSNEHVAGSEIVKLSTLYQGQEMRVDINHSDLLGCTVLGVCNLNGVAVTAQLIPPQGSHNPAYQRRPLTVGYNAKNADGTPAYTASIAAACGTTPCGAGFFSFYIPKNITGTRTEGNTFSNNTTDTWYTVVVTAKDLVDNHVVADGIARFKLNNTAVTNLKAENATAPGVDVFFPTSTVDITGLLRDNSSTVAQASRPAEDVVLDITVENPNGGTSSYQTNSCVNTSKTAGGDNCGGDAIGSTPNAHGGFKVTYGGPGGNGCSLDPSENGCNGGLGGVFGLFGSLSDTFTTGTYTVHVSQRDYNPAQTAETTFAVQLF